jgi:hypothetical protein
MQLIEELASKPPVGEISDEDIVAEVWVVRREQEEESSRILKKHG